MNRTPMLLQRGRAIALAGFCAAAFIQVAATDGFAQSAGARARGESNAARAYAQARSKSRRVRPRIRVTPLYPYRLESLPYPTPYKYEYPGPNGVRQCTARLVQEARPSGTVIVPRMTCWWERG